MQKITQTNGVKEDNLEKSPYDTQRTYKRYCRVYEVQGANAQV